MGSGHSGLLSKNQGSRQLHLTQGRLALKVEVKRSQGAPR
jgi:hypothetical protein